MYVFDLRTLSVHIFRPFYDAIQKVGFKVNYGPEDAGFPTLAFLRQGGHHIGNSNLSVFIS